MEINKSIRRFEKLTTNSIIPRLIFGKYKNLSEFEVHDMLNKCDLGSDHEINKKVNDIFREHDDIFFKSYQTFISAKVSAKVFIDMLKEMKDTSISSEEIY